MDGKSETYVEILSMAAAKLTTPTQYHEIVCFSHTQLTRRMEGLLHAREADPPDSKILRLLQTVSE
jgi:hypothetical protein